MATSTSRLALIKPAGTDLVSLADLNANYDKLDTNAGIILCTSGTRPSVPYSGQLIFETDTRRILQWSGSAWVNHSIGVLVCTTATRPSVPYAGQLIHDTDTNQILIRVLSTWVVIGVVGAPAANSIAYSTLSGFGTLSFTSGTYRANGNFVVATLNFQASAVQPYTISTNVLTTSLPTPIADIAGVGVGVGASTDLHSLYCILNTSSNIEIGLPLGVSARSLNIRIFLSYYSA